MKVIYHTANSRLTFEAELPNVKVAFEFVAVIQEMFEEPVCGCCKSDRIRPEMLDHTAFLKAICADPTLQP